QAGFLQIRVTPKIPRRNATPVGDWLASDGDSQNTITGKPVSYSSVWRPKSHGLTQSPVRVKTLRPVVQSCNNTLLEFE
ncbi:hypothetical protein ACQR3R_13450, partial [Gordonia sp. IEGM753]